MANVLEYKGYHTKVTYEAESKTLRGIIEGISDYVDFETDSPDEVENEFHSAVDDYLAFCKEVGKNPEKEYKGSFNIRIKPELHKKLAITASKADESINRTVERAIESYIGEDGNNNHILISTVQNADKSYSNMSDSSFNEEDIYSLIACQQNNAMNRGA